MGSGDYSGAITAYEQAISLSPTNYQAWRDKALCLKELKRYDEAMQTLNTILPIYKEKPELWSTAGDILLVDMQKYAESIPFLKKHYHLMIRIHIHWSTWPLPMIKPGNQNVPWSYTVRH
jgi:Flp pilus assembly protein TadD, contains TPR repeats